MRGKKLAIIVLVCALGAIILALSASYALFRLNVTKNSNFIVRMGNLELSIDDNNLGNVFEDGKIVARNLEPEKETTALLRDGYNFKVKNTGGIDSKYFIYLDEVTLENETKGKLNGSFVRINLTNNDTHVSHTYSFSAINGVVLDSGILDTNEEASYTLKIWLDLSADNTAQNKYFAVKIRIDGVQKNYKETLAEKILSSSPKYSNPTLIPNSNNLGDPAGLYTMNVTNGFGGGSGTTYYFRGDVINNYVSFAGNTWRVVRINEDGTIRLILEEGINDGAEEFVFGTDNSYMDAYLSNRDDYIKQTLDDWYSENITGTNDTKVASGNYFCEAARVKKYEGGLDNTEQVIYTSYIPDLVCSADGNGKGLLNLKIGLITYDEAFLAGIDGTPGHYLYKDYSWWTMSPESNAGSTPFLWMVDPAWEMFPNYTDYQGAVRPVINLKADVTATGTGTSADPYVIE